MESLSSKNTYQQLSDGTKMPMFGLGTYAMTDAQTIKKTVSEMGYRMYDCASFYKNEELVGQALKELFEEEKCVTREELYIISKIWWDEVEDVEAACRRSLTKLGLKQLDLYLVHWPLGQEAIQPTEEGGEITYKRINVPMYKIWAQMEALVDKGLVKSIGVSNFNVQLLWDMLSYARIKPVVNEVELHPLNTQLKLVKYMKSENIVPIGYCPIARGADTRKTPNIFEHEIVKKYMEKYNKTGAQILLNWGL